MLPSYAHCTAQSQHSPISAQNWETMEMMANGPLVSQPIGFTRLGQLMDWADQETWEGGGLTKCVQNIFFLKYIKAWEQRDLSALASHLMRNDCFWLETAIMQLPHLERSTFHRFLSVASFINCRETHSGRRCPCFLLRMEAKTMAFVLCHEP